MAFLGGLGGPLRTIKGKSKATTKRIAAEMVKELSYMRSRNIDSQYVWLCLNFDDSYTLTFGQPQLVSDVDCDGVTSGEEMSQFNDEKDMEYIAGGLLRSAREVRKELNEYGEYSNY